MTMTLLAVFPLDVVLPSFPALSGHFRTTPSIAQSVSIFALGVSAATVLIPMLICTAGTTVCRPIANSRAMSLYPQLAGTSTSAGSLLIFMCGGLISLVINLIDDHLTSTLAMCFLILSAIGLGLNALIRERTPAS